MGGKPHPNHDLALVDPQRLRVETDDSLAAGRYIDDRHTSYPALHVTISLMAFTDIRVSREINFGVG